MSRLSKTFKTMQNAKPCKTSKTSTRTLKSQLWVSDEQPWNKRRRSSLQWPVLLPLPQQSGNHGNQWQALQSGSGILRLILQLLHCLARKIASRSLLRCGFQMVAIVFANPLHPILSNSAGVTSSSKTKTLTDPNCAH